MAIKISPIESEDDYGNGRYFLPPPSKRLIVKRAGSSITRQIPKPVVLIDSREQSPFCKSALKIDPPSASNIDPPQAVIF